MISTIRPFQLFSKLAPDQRDVILSIPLVSGTESETISSLEILLLIAVARFIRAKSILELGTALGYTARHLFLNTNAGIATLDREIRAERIDGIKYLKADIFSPPPLAEFDMVFCDINYTPETVARSTEIAFASSPKVIAWHDYLNETAVTDFLPSLPHDLYHVGDTRLVFWFAEGL